MGFSEILDIIILCVLIYYIMKWIRKTHAWSLLRGFVILVIVALVAYLFNLVTVIWLVQNAFAMGFVALVILFQPELRKALEQLGRGVGSLSDRKGQMVAASIDEITHAMVNMSASRTGVLICIERTVALTDISNTGITVDAVLTRQLLMNIFTVNTPLHDGAVIVRDNRVLSAACILPLTAESVDYELGTRHRAALGLSEVSDALVIIVSEETGSISAASGGKLTRHLTEQKLREVLGAELLEEGKKRKTVWKSKKA